MPNKSTNSTKRRPATSGKKHKQARKPTRYLRADELETQWKEFDEWCSSDDLGNPEDADDWLRNGQTEHEAALDFYLHRYTRPHYDDVAGATYAAAYKALIRKHGDYDSVPEKAWASILPKSNGRVINPHDPSSYDLSDTFTPEFIDRCEAHEVNRKWNLRHRIVDGKILDTRWINPDLPSAEGRKELEARMAELRREAARPDEEEENGEQHMGNGKDHGDDDRVSYSRQEKWKQEQARRKANADGKVDPDDDIAAVKDRIHEKLKHKHLHLYVAEAFFKIMEEKGDDLKMVLDSKGFETMWHYDHETLLWSIVPNEKKFLDRLLQEAIVALKAKQKSSIKVIAEARNLVMNDPKLYPITIAFNTHGMIPVKKILIDPKTLQDRPITKDDHCTWTLDIVYDKNAKCPWWLRMLNDMFGDRTKDEKNERVALLQDFMGAGLVDNKKKALRRTMVIIGESNSGKSALLDIMSEMITDDPITTPIADLNNPHGTQAFIRRAPWILHEAFDQSAWHVSSKAKLIIGGDPFEVNPKGSKAVSIAHTAPTVFATNHPPKFRESTKAMINRMILLRTTFVFEEGKEIGAAAEARKHDCQEPQEFILKTEKSGILNWMLIGAQRAIKNGKYYDTEEGKEALHEVRLDSNVVAGFVEECIDFNENIRISVPDFNAAFLSWWKEHRGDDHNPSPDQIGRSLKALSHAKIAMDRHKFKDKKGVRYICGIELNEAGEAHWENTADAVNGPGNQAKGDLARISSTFAGVHSQIPPGDNWWDHPLMAKIRANAAKEEKAED